MSRVSRCVSPFLPSVPLALIACIVGALAACNPDDLHWPKEDPATGGPAPGCDGSLPGPMPPGGGAPGQTLPGSTLPDPGQSVPPVPGSTQTSAGPGADTGSASSTGGDSMPSDGTAAASSGVPAGVQVQLWELLYDPEGADGLADSPEVLDLLITGTPSHKGVPSFVLSAKGWSTIRSTDLLGEQPIPLPVGGLLRIERYKNQAELDLANERYPLVDILDPGTQSLAVKILRLTGSGIRNKGGWVKLQDLSSATTSGLIYAQIEATLIDPELATIWQGPFADKAPSGDALCRVPKPGQESTSAAALWTPCEPSSWGRDPQAPRP